MPPVLKEVKLISSLLGVGKSVSASLLALTHRPEGPPHVVEASLTAPFAQDALLLLLRVAHP